MTNTKINTIDDFLCVIKSHQKIYEQDLSPIYNSGLIKNLEGPPWYKYKANLWFRGQAENQWELKPHVERDNFISAAANAKTIATDYEQSIFRQFVIQGEHLFPKGLTIVQKYFLAQHYGLPTRLLDWSTNPLAALFFASSESQEKDGAVYLFFSRITINNHEENDIIYQDNSEFIEMIENLPTDNHIYKDYKNRYPLRIVPTTLEGRINSQNSRFTFHLNEGLPLENIIKNGINKFTVPASSKKSILEDLRVLGIHWSSLFPDLDNLAKEIKRQVFI